MTRHPRDSIVPDGDYFAALARGLAGTGWALRGRLEDDQLDDSVAVLTIVLAHPSRGQAGFARVTRHQNVLGDVGGAPWHHWAEVIEAVNRAGANQVARLGHYLSDCRAWVVEEDRRIREYVDRRRLHDRTRLPEATKQDSILREEFIAALLANFYVHDLANRIDIKRRLNAITEAEQFETIRRWDATGRPEHLSFFTNRHPERWPGHPGRLPPGWESR